MRRSFHPGWDGDGDRYGDLDRDAYRDAVLADTPLDYWPLDDDSLHPVLRLGRRAAADLTVTAESPEGAPARLLNDTRPSSTFDGSSADSHPRRSRSQVPTPSASRPGSRRPRRQAARSSGSKQLDGTSGSYTGMCNMEPDGRITFGVYPGSVQTITSSASYNDGSVASDLGRPELGRHGPVRGWRARRDAHRRHLRSALQRLLAGRRDSPWSGAAFFAGAIDDVANLRARPDPPAGGRTLRRLGAHAPPPHGGPPMPNGAAVYALEPSLYWRWRRRELRNIAADASGFGNPALRRRGRTRRGRSAEWSERHGGDVLPWAGDQQEHLLQPRSYSLEAWFKTRRRPAERSSGSATAPTETPTTTIGTST